MHGKRRGIELEDTGVHSGNQLKRNKFTKRIRNESEYWILLGIILNLITYIPLFFLFGFQYGYEGTIQATALAILYALIGLILWAVLRFYFGYRYLSLGFLIGGFTTFAAVYLLPSSP